MKIIYTFDEVCALNFTNPETMFTLTKFEKLSKIYGVTVKTVSRWHKNDCVPAKYIMRYNVPRPSKSSK